MAKIYLRGAETIILQDEEKAKRIKELWLKGELEKKVDLGEQGSFESSAIKRIELAGGSSFYDDNEMEYRWTDPAQRAKIDEHQREWEQWLEENKGKYVKGDYFFWFLRDKGAVRMLGDGKDCRNYGIRDIEKYRELNKLHSSLSSLKLAQEKQRLSEQMSWEDKGLDKLID